MPDHHRVLEYHPRWDDLVARQGTPDCIEDRAVGTVAREIDARPGPVDGEAEPKRGVAIERVGENARLEEDNSNWPVGLKDARRCTGSKAYSGPQNCLTPKYWDYSIYANMILLCSGGDVETASILCNDLLTAPQPQPDEA